MELNYIVFLLVLCSFNKLLVLVVATSEEHVNHRGDQMSTRFQIATAQYECFQRIMKESHPGPVCNTTWDGWLCWDETEAGLTTEQSCPEYYDDFDPLAVASKVCTETGEWGRHPESNRTWTNFTNCRANTTHHNTAAMTHFYLVMIGHGLSLVSLFISLGIFFHFKSLSCQRITLHKNLFVSFVLNSVITIVLLTTVAKTQGHMNNSSVSCKLLQFIHYYLLSCNYFWMLCEGIYLHTLIVVAVFAEKQHLIWYYLLGWGFPLVPAVIHSIARQCYYNDNCWVSSDTSLLYIIHGPICAALVVNLFFLLNIVRVLITKLRVTHQAESSLYMRAVRATLILIPLLGIQFVLFPYKPREHWVYEIYLYVMDILMHYQGLLVSTIFCFFNGEVQSVLRRHWNQQRMQFAGTFANADFFRSASYVASSLTEVHRCYSIESHTERSLRQIFKGGCCQI
uniref:Calcitonin gene-related peptide type 1 receptor n=1 Tax=Lates calcarifer TaxID=8187 RepID=A0A4W6D8G2_LATCA